MSKKLHTFRELVEERYLNAHGFAKIRAFAKIYLESGVSISSQRAAFNGTNVLAETVEDLATWAFQVHRVELDQLALLKAPTKEARDEGKSVLARLATALADNDVTPADVHVVLEEHMRAKETA